MDEIEEYKKYLLSTGAKPDEVEEYGVYLKSQQAPAEATGLAERALDVGLRTLDIPGGAARVTYKGLQNLPRAAAKGLQELGLETALAQQPHLVTGEDFLRALQGRAPTMAEFAEREGAEPGIGTTLTGIAGDIALDPLTYLSFGTSTLKKGAEKAGKSIYKSGLKNLDIEAAKYGKEPVSELLMKEGVTGTAEQIQKRMDELAKGYLKERDVILKEADKAAGRVSMKDAMQPLLEKIKAIKESKDPNLQAVAQAMEKDAERYLSLEKKADIAQVEEFITPSQATGFKSSEYNRIGDEAYREAAQTQAGKSLQKTKAYGLKNAIENSVEQSLGKSAKETLQEYNKKLGQILTTQEKAEQEAAKELRKNAVTSVDAPLALLAPKAAAGKKLIDLSKGSEFRTRLGKAVSDRSKSNMLLERNLLTSPWLELARQKEK